MITIRTRGEAWSENVSKKEKPSKVITTMYSEDMKKLEELVEQTGSSRSEILRVAVQELFRKKDQIK